MRIVPAITAAALIAAQARAEDLIGFVGLNGPAPMPARIPDSQAVGCGEQVFDPVVAVGHDRLGLQNVLVWVATDVPASPPPAKPLVIDQQVCKYLPRVSVALPGQQIVVKNSQAIPHFVRTKVGPRTLFNKGLAAGAPPVEMVARANPGLMVLGCDIHPWMRSYIHVLPHRFAAITDQEGSFTIRGLPPGQYTVRAWHERLGEQEAEVVIPPGSSGLARFTFAYTDGRNASSRRGPGEQAAVGQQATIARGEKQG